MQSLIKENCFVLRLAGVPELSPPKAAVQTTHVTVSGESKAEILLAARRALVGRAD